MSVFDREKATEIAERVLATRTEAYHPHTKAKLVAGLMMQVSEYAAADYVTEVLRKNILFPVPDKPKYGWVDYGNGRSVFQRQDVPKRGPRSDLSAPMIVTDTMDALWHPSTGELIESKSQFRSVTKAHGGTEVGTETQTDNRWNDVATKDDVGEAIRMVKDGYKPASSETASEGWS